jgi:hypothetical protein
VLLLFIGRIYLVIGRCRKEIDISLLQQNQVTPQVLDTEQYNIELISEPLPAPGEPLS